jgi:hypothetical protein
MGFAAEPSLAQGPPSPVAAETQCSLDLDRPGFMKDIVSNALHLGLDHAEPDVKAFLTNAESRYSTGQALLKAAAEHFEVRVADLATEVERFRHCNCKHGTEGEEDDANVSQFARDVTLHVVLHELGHALIREFDLPVLGNEETMADAFATHYLTHHRPDRALDVLLARTQSLLIEAREVPRDSWEVSGEHNNDARRAFQIAALAVAANPEKYRSLVAAVDMSEAEVRKSRDYGTEIHRSWRRILQPLWMPEGLRSQEARLVWDEDSEFIAQLCNEDLAQKLRDIVQRFDWHSQVTIRFVEGEGGAGWSRSKRTITVHSEYVQRFVRQGKAATD